MGKIANTMVKSQQGHGFDPLQYDSYRGHNVPTTQGGSFSVIWPIWGRATRQGGDPEFKSCSDR